MKYPHSGAITVRNDEAVRGNERRGTDRGGISPEASPSFRAGVKPFITNDDIISYVKKEGYKRYKLSKNTYESSMKMP